MDARLDPRLVPIATQTFERVVYAYGVLGVVLLVLVFLGMATSERDHENLLLMILVCVGAGGLFFFGVWKPIVVAAGCWLLASDTFSGKLKNVASVTLACLIFTLMMMEG